MEQKTYFTYNEVKSSRKVPNPNLQNAKKRGGAIKATNTKGLKPLTTQSAKERHINIVMEHVHERQKWRCEA
jgi:hypothetical protein